MLYSSNVLSVIKGKYVESYVEGNPITERPLSESVCAHSGLLKCIFN